MAPPAIPMQFIYLGSREPSINKLWLESLAASSNSATGLRVSAELPQQLDLHTDAISPQQTQLKVTAGVGASEGAAAAAFEAELAFEGVEYGLDPLANATELTEARFLVFAVGTDQGGTKLSVMKASKSRPAKPLSPRMT